MNKKLQKQIKTYVGVAGTILGSDKLNAQVNYVDINPDTTIALLTGNFITAIGLDMDSNLSVDFLFKAESTAGVFTSFTSSVIKAYAVGNNKILQDSCLPLAMQNGDYIGVGGGNWSGPGVALLRYLSGMHSYGNWFVGDDKCLGINFFYGGQNHYGWIHLEIVGPKAFKLKDYAYQLQPNVPMLACDTTNLATGISQSDHPQFNFSQQNNSIHISTFQKSNHSNIYVYDLLGKEILQQPFEGKESTITLDKKGIYFVEVNSKKGIFRKKVFIYKL